jgi:hypothetical protein
MDAETIHTVAAILADGYGWVAPLRQSDSRRGELEALR